MSLNYLFKAIPWLGFFAAITISWIYYLKARNKERLALIEKGTDTPESYLKIGETLRFPWLKIGVVLTGISLGVSMVIIFAIAFPNNDWVSQGIAVIMIISGILFGSIAMIVAHFVDRPQKKK